MSTEIEQRLAQIEARLGDLEAVTGAAPGPLAKDSSSALEAVPAASAVGPGMAAGAVAARDAQSISKGNAWSVTKLLGWGGASAVVLAFAYLIRLAIIDGWLTPGRQVGFAVLAGLILVAAGIKLREADREYASLLPAGGMVILFLAIYGAHLYYDLISRVTAGVSVLTVCVAALWLCRLFNSQLYALFAVVGSYSAPFLLGEKSGELTDLVIYYSCWSVVFSAFSVWVGNRSVYLLALYMSLVGFDILWKAGATPAGLAVVVFQLLQLLIFVICAVVYATRHKEPMTQNVALAHAPALLIFYSLEYAALEQYSPGLAPWVAVASAAMLLLAYLLAKRYLDQSLAGSKWLIAAYCALVLLHAGYLESVPDGWGPWVALSLIGLAAAYLLMHREAGLLDGPIGWVVALIYAGNYVRLITGFDVGSVPARELLMVLYALQLYVAYYFLSREGAMARYAPGLSYAGHIAAMTAVTYIFDGRFAVSITWGLLALACLLLALKVRDKVLGQSSLLIFAASTLKVFAFDLSDAAPLVRIACLFALGISLYAGGWLYRKIESIEPTSAADS